MTDHRIFHNALFNTASWVVAVLLSLVFLPYIVGRLGADGYGVLVLVLSVIGYFAVLDLNLGDAVIKYVAQYHAEGKMGKVNEVVGSVMLLYLALGCAAGVTVLLLSGELVTHLLDIKPELRPAALFAFRVGGAGILLTMISSALAAIPNGVNRYDITSKATMALGLFTSLGTVGLLYLGAGLRGVVLLNLAVSVAGIAFYVAIGKRLLPGLALRPVLSLASLGTVLRYGLFSLMSRLSTMLQFQGVRLVAGAVLGVASVTYYVVPFNLVSRAMAVTFRVGGVIFPVISALQGKRDFDSVARLYLKASRLIFAISTALCLPLFLFGGRFLALWMGESFRAQTGSVLLLLTASLYIDTCTNIPSNVLNGLGMPKVCGFFAMANAGINLALVYPLSRWLNIDGIALAFLAGHVLVAPAFVAYVTKRVLNLSLVRLFQEVYLLPAAAGLVTALPFLFLLRLPFTGVAAVLGAMLATSLLYLAVSCGMGVFSREERAFVVQYFRPGRKERAAGALEEPP
ncbi:MATE family efflux transporter [Geomesophilobacter sediminis]|uniref:Polysaccharide biosynthesis C-terminal domain-containing protein n=1 Tax=Geomesophilobacter sediminis TaxID=2798584 RepID=A0A8J7LYS3_9BACT|nr:polysaccharide biosynthesis C-terminal domain-containing protein [Geomesophilobacter sediminis]MBJ6725362.1 polysaccharide biosynthesis C-terminal domain-containing protein [Geomesophilobacter sediminis]